MSTLSNRFRDVTIIFTDPSPPSTAFPATWLEPQTSDCVLHFVDSDFKEDSPRELAVRFPSARDIEVEPMTLRQIFLAIAKSGRDSAVSAAQEKEA
jgi:ABC-2 type transport system ATP-binding protein